jgi:hypothetical protein
MTTEPVSFSTFFLSVEMTLAEDQLATLCVDLLMSSVHHWLSECLRLLLLSCSSVPGLSSRWLRVVSFSPAHFCEVKTYK